MSTYFVAGASRGIGLEHVKQILGNYGGKVIAGARNIENKDLQELKKKYPNHLSLITLDTSSTESKAAAEIQKSHPEGIDYIINNAAIQDTKSVDSSPDEIVRVFNVNTAGPLRVIQALLPSIKKGKKKVVINISTNGGSFGFGRVGLHEASKKIGEYIYGYKTSKAALNLLTVDLSLRYAEDGIIIVPIEPGVVETDGLAQYAPDLDAFRKFGILETPAESVKQQLEVIHKLTLEDSGKFFSHKGNVLPW